MTRQHRQARLVHVCMCVPPERYAGPSSIKGEILQFVVTQDLFDLCAPELQPAILALKKAILKWAGSDQAGAVQLVSLAASVPVASSRHAPPARCRRVLHSSRRCRGPVRAQLRFLASHVHSWSSLLPGRPLAAGYEVAGEAADVRLPDFLEAAVVAVRILRAEEMHQRAGPTAAAATAAAAASTSAAPATDAPPLAEQEADPAGAPAAINGDAAEVQAVEGSSDEAAAAAAAAAPGDGILPPRPSAAQLAAARTLAQDVCECLRTTVKPDTLMVLPALPYPPPRRASERPAFDVFAKLTEAFNAVATLGGCPSLTSPVGVLRDGSPVAISILAVHRCAVPCAEPSHRQRRWRSVCVPATLTVGARGGAMQCCAQVRQAAAGRDAAPVPHDRRVVPPRQGGDHADGHAQGERGEAGFCTARCCAKSATAARLMGVGGGHECRTLMPVDPQEAEDASSGPQEPAANGRPADAPPPSAAHAAANGRAARGGAPAAPPPPTAQAAQAEVRGGGAPAVDPKKVERAEKAKARGNELYQAGQFTSTLAARTTPAVGRTQRALWASIMATPSRGMHSFAERKVCHVLCLVRQVPGGHERVHQGHWLQPGVARLLLEPRHGLHQALPLRAGALVVLAGFFSPCCCTVRQGMQQRASQCAPRQCRAASRRGLCLVSQLTSCSAPRTGNTASLALMLRAPRRPRTTSTRCSSSTSRTRTR